MSAPPPVAFKSDYYLVSTFREEDDDEEEEAQEEAAGDGRIRIGASLLLNLVVGSGLIAAAGFCSSLGSSGLALRMQAQEPS